MKKIFTLIFAFLAFAASAESPVGGGKPNMSLDSSPCFSWTGNTSGATWTRCPAVAPIAPTEKIIYVDRPVIVEKIVEKIVEVPSLRPANPQLTEKVLQAPPKKKATKRRTCLR